MSLFFKDDTSGQFLLRARVRAVTVLALLLLTIVGLTACQKADTPTDVHRDDPGLLDGLGEIREREGRYDQARRLFERIKKLDLNHPETEADLSRIAFLKEAFELGEPILRQVVEDAPEDFAARARLGRFYFDHYQMDEAGLQLRGAAVKLKSVAVLLGEAQVTSIDGDLEGAIHSILRALELDSSHRGAARDLVRTVFSLGTEEDTPVPPDQDSAWAWWSSGMDHAKAKEWAKARSAFGKSLAIEVDQIAKDSIDVRDVVGLTRPGAAQLDRFAGMTFEQGTRAFSENRLEEAKSLFLSCIRLSPMDSRGYLLLALVVDELGDTLTAASYAREGSFLEPGYAEVYGVLGTVAQNSEDLDLARRHYRVALAFDPGAVGAALNLSQIQLEQGNRDEARQTLLRLLDRDPQNEPARQMLKQIQGAS